MKVKFIVDEDIANYKLISMFIGFPHCTFKCDHECGQPICQNSQLISEPDIDIPIEYIINRYLSNPLSQALVIGGLEPFDDYDDLIKLIQYFRNMSNDDIVIYTGYNEHEKNINDLLNYDNIIIKYGRFIPNGISHFDNILGVTLASSNQYAVKYGG